MIVKQYRYSLNRLKAMARSLPVGYLQEREAKADYAAECKESPNETIYFYKEETEKYFSDKYSKYAISEVVLSEFDQESLPKIKIPKKISGCCDRADQY